MAFLLLISCQVIIHFISCPVPQSYSVFSVFPQGMQVVGESTAACSLYGAQGPCLFPVPSTSYFLTPTYIRGHIPNYYFLNPFMHLLSMNLPNLFTNLLTLSASGLL